MYHSIVRSVLRGVFRDLNKGDPSKLISMFAEKPEHFFAGRSSLGGTRHSIESIRRWYERLYEIFPNIRFEAMAIVVRGWPWKTTAAVEWVNKTSVVDGVQWHNQGVNMIDLRWGKVASVRIYCDTSVEEELCRILASRGLQAAAASQIVD